MNKERDDKLQDLATYGVSFFKGGQRIDPRDVYISTEPEQEPVAWCQMVEGKVQDLLTSFEMKDWLYDKSWIPLYTAPPKREPIEDGELEVWYSQHTWAMDKQEYMWGFRDAEKAHGIGGGE